MRISEGLRARRPFFSFEFFPPQDDAGVAQLLETIETLRSLRPAYVSITYGAGGSARARTVELSKRIQNEIGLTVMSHVTCVGSSKRDLRNLFYELRDSGIENIMALRGDPPRGQSAFVPDPNGFAYASELIAMLRREFDFCIGGAAYPEKHPDAVSFEDDLGHLVEKVNAGAEFLVTQLFFDNEAYFRFVERVRAAGIRVPILPGIWPITNYKQIARITAMCGSILPPKLRSELEARAEEPEAVKELGVSYATLQCTDLLRRGAPGIHFYTLNRSPATRAVVSALHAATAWQTYAELLAGSQPPPIGKLA
ncbi:MAG: methylenetetrahydrofolate reductase [NAD(P)H] [Candidatus Meridianibacter frigidus]|nr:MAG: methylenetetrahydrofolate reductase [NAD(P)H] [Candidatus Eremiobacteraeota bacterium]